MKVKRRDLFLAEMDGIHHSCPLPLRYENRLDRKPVLNRNLWEQLLKLSEGRQINWQWVKGHAGNPLNEAVDTLAWQAARIAAVHRKS